MTRGNLRGTLEVSTLPTHVHGRVCLGKFGVFERSSDTRSRRFDISAVTHACNCSEILLTVCQAVAWKWIRHIPLIIVT